MILVAILEKMANKRRRHGAMASLIRQMRHSWPVFLLRDETEGCAAMTEISHRIQKSVTCQKTKRGIMSEDTTTHRQGELGRAPRLGYEARFKRRETKTDMIARR